MARDTLLSMPPADLSAGLFDHARPVHLDPGQSLFLAGDPGDGCYRVDEGLVKVHVISSSGGDRILAILGPGMRAASCRCSTGRRDPLRPAQSTSRSCPS